MTQDSYITEVIFRKFKEGDIIALFPYHIETYDGSVQSYMHVGQHGGAVLELINDTSLATPDEYKDLYTELISIGYNLKVIKKANRNKYAQALHEIRSKYK